MNEIDWIIAGAAVLFAALGYMQGAILGVFALVGMVAGGVLGTRLAQMLLDEAQAAPSAPLVGMLAAVATTLLVALLVQNFGAALRERVRTREGVALDRMLGGVVAVVLLLVLTWFAGALVMSTERTRALRPYVTDSRVLTVLNEALPPSGPILNTIARYDPLPAFDGPSIAASPPDETLPSDPEVRAAAASVVRIEGPACGWVLTGTGWVVAPGLVVTNAHVVAGHERTTVQPGGTGGRLDARVVAFDRVDDLAVLAVPGLDLAPLPVADSAPDGAAGAVLGYPENGPFDVRAARVDDTEQVRSTDIYGNGPTERGIVAFRGLVRHGNSGGPLVDGDGRVMATIFAGAVGTSEQGGYGVPNEDMRELVAAAGPTAVGTGPCI